MNAETNLSNSAAGSFYIAVTTFVLSLGILSTDVSQAAGIADDSAGDAVYDSGWLNGQNGGSGFSSWQLTVPGSGGHFISSSSGNAGGSGNIDTANRAWGMWSTNATTEAVRSFTGNLSTGQAFHISFDNGWIQNGRSAGLALRNNAGENLWEFFFSGGDGNYTINDNAGALHSDIPFTGDGLSLEFNLTGPTSYFLRVYAQVAGGTATTFYVYSGNLISHADQGIAQFRLWNYEAGPGSEYDAFFNSVAVTPSVLQPSVGDPYVDSWFMDSIGAYARIFESDADKSNNVAKTTWTRGSTTQATPTYGGVMALYSSVDWLYFRSSGLGLHVMGPWYLNAQHNSDFPNFPVNKKLLWRIPRNALGLSAKSSTGLGAIGSFVDGVSMFDSRDGFVWNGTNETGNGIGYWNRDAYINESVTFDPANAHQEQSGNYHYHANPIALRYLAGDHVTYNSTNRTYAESTTPVTNHSPILGWVRDGHPVYGPYGYANATNPLSGIRLMISGYALRNGSNGTDNITGGRTAIPAWAQRAYGVGAAQSGPPVSTNFPLGRYMEDKAYLGDLGQTKGVQFDLDEYNGRFCVTPEYPNGTYAYFVSIASNGAPVFPYNIGRQFHGSITGGAVSSIVESVTTNFLGGPYGQEAMRDDRNSGSDITLVWSSVEGGGYVVESSTNLTSWVQVATNTAATNSSATIYTNAGGASGADTKFYRVTRKSLATFDAIITTNGAGGGGGGSGIVSIAPNTGNRGSSYPFTITFDNTAPPQMAPVISLRIGTNVISGATHATQLTVTGNFAIGAGAATGAQDVVLVWPGPPPPGNPLAYVTNTLPGGFMIQ